MDNFPVQSIERSSVILFLLSWANFWFFLKQPFNLTAAVLFVASGAGMWAYFNYEKERLARQRIAEQTKGVGRPKVGGPFDLIDHNGHQFTHEDMHGKYALVCSKPFLSPSPQKKKER